MMPFLLRKKMVSFRIETMIITVVIIALLILPGAAVASMTNVKALIGSGSGGGEPENAALYTGPSPADNTYAWGNCTYWVFIERMNAGDPIPNTWGNAATWAFYARLQGYRVDQIPSAGAIMQTADAAGGLGHVAYITSVDSKTGAWTISEMNVKGLDIVDTQTYSAAVAIDYNFIHDKEK